MESIAAYGEGLHKLARLIAETLRSSAVQTIEMFFPNGTWAPFHIIREVADGGSEGGPTPTALRVEVGEATRCVRISWYTPVACELTSMCCSYWNMNQNKY